MNQATPPRAKSRGTARLIIIAMAAIGAAWLLWAQGIRDHVIPKNFGVVEDGRLYRSAALTPAALTKVHREYGIRTIVDLGAYDKHPREGLIAERTAAGLGIDRFVFPLEGDGTGNPNAYVQALRIITDPDRQPVLVHCSAGAQRTTGCVLLYEEEVHGRARADLEPSMRTYGHDYNDNPRLRPYLDEWAAKIHESLRTGTPIPGFPSLDPAAAEPPDRADGQVTAPPSSPRAAAEAEAPSSRR